MGVGLVFSYLLADPFVATASALAFASSELADWALYSFTKMPFHRRVLWSSALSTPIDTLLFLGMIGALTPGTAVLMIISKMIAAYIIWYTHRNVPASAYAD